MTTDIWCVKRVRSSGSYIPGYNLYYSSKQYLDIILLQERKEY